LGLQETMRQTYTREMLSSMSGVFDFDWTSCPGKSGGILVGINKDSCEVLDREIDDYP
jgi:hypothetical protein